MTIYIGIDQSYSSSGFFITNDDNEVITFGTVAAKKQEGVDIFQRAWSVAHQLAEVVDRYTDPIVSIEGLSFGGFGSATRDLAGLQFTIINTLRESYGIPTITIVPPTTLKKFASGKGKCSKNDMVASMPVSVYDMIITDKYKKSTGLYDITDAYFLAQYMRVQHNKGTI